MKDIGTNSNPLLPKDEFYKDLAEQINVTNLSNASAVIFHELNSLEHFQRKPINWAGFYIANPNNSQQLILGPFQGKVACTEIPFGKGVCGSAASTMQTQLVRDVHEFPGHIACDSASNSEVVVPLVVDGRLVGVLDIDCQEKEGFDDSDRIGLEAVAKIIIDNCTWTL
ncbi:unnamed protein product [Absidia cylindrospora]